MNKKHTFFVLIVTMLVALQASAMPIPYRINGTELASSTRYLPEMMIPDFLEGAIWAPVSDVSSVDINHVRTHGNYSIGCFVVHYKSDANRAAECYVITYKVEEKGVIDAVLAYVEEDIKLCRGNFMFPDRFLYLESTGSKCQMHKGEFDVTRGYRARMGNEGGDMLSESGDLTRHYTIDDNGIIIPGDFTTDAIWKHEPNLSVPGRKVGPTDAEQEKLNESRVLGPGAELFDLYGTPLHNPLTDKDFDGMLGWTENIRKQIGWLYSEPLATRVKLWRERAVYRNWPKADAHKDSPAKKAKKSKKSKKRK